MASRKTPSKAHTASAKPANKPANKSAKAAGTSGKAAKRSAQERIAEQRAAQRRAERRRWIVTYSVVGVVVAALAGGAVWAVTSQNRAEDKAAVANETKLPPWPVPADPVVGARAAGLDVQPMEGTAKHFHAHLDVLVNGKPVEVAANLGIDPGGQAMSELHTHDTRGVLHVEAPTANKRYTLGQVFKTWQVRLTATELGGLKAGGGNTLTAYVDGKKHTGDPASIELTSHRQIALVYGPAGQKVNVPSTYKFENGE